MGTRTKQPGPTFWLDACGDVRAEGPWPSDEAGALEASIEHWRAIVSLLERGDDVQSCGNAEACALCHRAGVGALGHLECTLCPVFRSTKERGCLGTPYMRFEDAEDTAEQLAVAEAEVAFLESLRPLVKH